MSETNEKTTWHERLVVEHAELKDKLVKLVSFINSEEYYKLSENNRKVLQNQKFAMEFYLNILNMRVYQNVDEIVVPDMAILGLMTGLFAAPFGSFQKTETEKKLEAMLADSKKDAKADKRNLSEVGAPDSVF